MRKLITAVAFLSASSALACSFSVRTGNDPKTPAPTTPKPGVAAPTPTPAPVAPRPLITAANGRVTSFGKKGAAAGPVSPTVPPAGTGTAVPAGTASAAPTGSTPAATPPSAAPGALPFLAGTNAFGSGTPDPNGGWQGTLFRIPAGTSKMPALASLAPVGLLFAPALSTSSQAMTGGFPGIDPALNENFAIRWEAPLVVENEADYEIRVTSDDGAVLSIDGMPIVDNDGAHTAKDKSGPVHLVKGTHSLQLDYFQATGPVALSVYVKKIGSASEALLVNKL